MPRYWMRRGPYPDEPPEPGPPGPAFDPLFTIVAAANLAPGMPVYVNGLGKLAPASAAALASSSAVGLCAAATASGFAAPVNCASLSLSNWAAIAGAAALSPNQTYYLGVAPGTISAVAPSTPGLVVVPVGRAVSATTLEISIAQPVLL